MFDAGRRPTGRLFYWLLTVVIAASGFGACGFTERACSSDWAGDDYDRGHGLFGGWNDGFGNSDHHMAGVCDGERGGGGGWGDERDAGSEWGAQRGAGAECGSDSGGSVLHGRLPDWAGRSED